MSDPDPSTLWGPAGQSKQASLKHIIWGPGNEEQMLKTSTLWWGETAEIRSCLPIITLNN